MPTVYVNTASVGGDGTTNNTSGATAAYSSLQAAITGEAANITGLGNLEFLCDGAQDSTVVAAADWTGWTTTSSDRVVIKVNPDNAPKPLTVDTSKYHFKVSGAYSAGTPTYILEVGNGTNTVHVTLSIPVIREFTSGYNTGNTRSCVGHSSNADLIVDGAIIDIRGMTNAGVGGTACIGGGGSSGAVYNTLFLGSKSGSSGNHIGISGSGMQTLDCYNNMFINLDTGKSNAATNYAKNNIFQGCTTEFTDATPDTNVQYNLTDNATINSSGTGDLVSKTLTFAGVDDFNLLDNTTGANADVIGAGIGPSADANVPTLDAYGNTRSGATSDLLPYEYALAAAPTNTTINVDIPADIDLEWGTTHELAVTHDGGTTTLSGVTLSAPTGWETVSFSTIPDTGTTESFYEYSQSDVTVGNFTAQVGDTLAFTSATGLTIDGSSIPVVNPAATVTGSYKWWDASLSTWTPVSSYTITNLGVFGGGDTTVMIQEMISDMISEMVN